jgi:hypothetical protein
MLSPIFYHSIADISIRFDKLFAFNRICDEEGDFIRFL